MRPYNLQIIDIHSNRGIKLWAFINICFNRRLRLWFLTLKRQKPSPKYFAKIDPIYRPIGAFFIHLQSSWESSINHLLSSLLILNFLLSPLIIQDWNKNLFYIILSICSYVQYCKGCLYFVVEKGLIFQGPITMTTSLSTCRKKLSPKMISSSWTLH